MLPIPVGLRGNPSVPGRAWADLMTTYRHFNNHCPCVTVVSLRHWDSAESYAQWKKAVEEVMQLLGNIGVNQKLLLQLYLKDKSTL